MWLLVINSGFLKIVDCNYTTIMHYSNRSKLCTRCYYYDINNIVFTVPNETMLGFMKKNLYSSIKL